MITVNMYDVETGELFKENYKILDGEDISNRAKGAKKRELEEGFKRLQQEVLGNFVFFLFSDISKLSNKLKDSDLVKFIYLGTYVRKDGTLRLDNNKTNITKKMLPTLLGLSKNKALDFYKTLIDNKLIIENEDGFLYINPTYFFRGKDKEYKKLTGDKLKEFTRLYTKSTRALYEETPLRNYKGLAMTYKLIPFTNWKFNVLCENVNETDEEQIKPINLGKVLELLGWKKNNLKKMLVDLMAIKIQGYNVFLRIGNEWDVMTDCIVVNPLAFYRSSDRDELYRLISLFKIVK